LRENADAKAKLDELTTAWTKLVREEAEPGCRE